MQGNGKREKIGRGLCGWEKTRFEEEKGDIRKEEGGLSAGRSNNLRRKTYRRRNRSKGVNIRS